MVDVPEASGRPTFGDWRARELARGAAKPRTAEQEFHRNATIAVARKAETVVNHEGWQTFLDHLGAMVDAAKNARDAQMQTLTFGVHWGDDLAEFKAKAREYAAEARAYERAMKLIPTLVQNGLAAQDAPPDASTG